MTTAAQRERWRADPVAFVYDVLRDPETGQPFELYPEQEQFLRELAALVDEGGQIEAVFSAIKKSGKTTLAATVVLWFIACVAGRFGEGYCCANDLEQSQGRVFKTIARIVDASPLLRGEAKATQSTIEFGATGATVTALASDYAGAAGANPSITVFDELWAYTTERSRRLWDEMQPVPTRAVSLRLTVTYAGFEGESALLEELIADGKKGEPVDARGEMFKQPGLLLFLSHRPLAPWQTDSWLDRMRKRLRRSAFLRMLENRFVAGESEFVPVEWWDACTDSALRPAVRDTNLDVWVGVDASTKRDSTAIVAVTFDEENNRVHLIWHRIFRPSPEDPLDFESTVESTLLELKDRFRVREVAYDPYQMAAVAQRLENAGLPMVEFPQSVPRLTEAGSNLYELIKGRGLLVYSDDEIRLAVQRAVAKETARGLQITKEKTAHKIDVVVALAMAALGAVREGQSARENWDPEDVLLVRSPLAERGVASYADARALETQQPVAWAASPDDRKPWGFY